MTDAPQKADARTEEIEAAEAERKLGRALALGIPSVSVAAAIVVGVLASAGPAILVLVGGALLGAIALLWASVRTLGGDAPLAEDMEALAVRAPARGELNARKLTVLRALKDLKHEHEIGKIDDADYAALDAKYRGEAKGLLRELDTEVEPYRAKAEALAQKHLAKVGLAPKPEPEPVTVTEPAKAVTTKAPLASDRVPCPKCETANDPDAAFCKKCATPLAAPRDADADADKESHA